MKFYNLIIAGLVFVVSSCSNEETSSTEATNTDSNKIESTATNVGALGIPDGTYFLTKEKHTISWEASKITGSSHSGIMKSENGKFTVENGAISRGILSLNMNDFEVTDLEGERKVNFEDHLKSDDFLNVEAFPVAKLIMNGSSLNENGNMSLSCAFDFHGVVVNYTIPFFVKEIKKDDGTVRYQINGKFIIDRTKHNMTYGSGSFYDDLGDRVINDDVKIGFGFTAI